MQLFAYSLLLCIALEWSFSSSFTIIDDFPEGKVQERLKKYLDAKKNGKETPKKTKNEKIVVGKQENEQEIPEKKEIEHKNSKYVYLRVRVKIFQLFQELVSSKM